MQKDKFELLLEVVTRQTELMASQQEQMTELMARQTEQIGKLVELAEAQDRRLRGVENRVTITPRY